MAMAGCAMSALHSASRGRVMGAWRHSTVATSAGFSAARANRGIRAPLPRQQLHGAVMQRCRCTLSTPNDANATIRCLWTMESALNPCNSPLGLHADCKSCRHDGCCLPPPLPPRCSLQLPTVDTRRAVRFQTVPCGTGQAILVAEVAQGSEAEAVRTGGQWMVGYMYSSTAMCNRCCCCSCCCCCSFCCHRLAPPLPSPAAAAFRCCVFIQCLKSNHPRTTGRHACGAAPCRHQRSGAPR